MNPQVGQSANLLLRQLVAATSAIAVIGIEEAPQDGRQYTRVNGAWVPVAEPILDGVVDTYANLPVALNAPKVGDVYLVMAASGTYFVNRHPAGLYARVTNHGNLSDWQYEATLTDSEV